MTAETRRAPSPIAVRVLHELGAEPDRVAVADDWRTYRADELLERIQSVARALGEIRDLRVLASAPNCAESVILFLATMAAGGMWTSINPRYGAAEQRALAERFAPTVVVGENHAVADLTDAVPAAVGIAFEPGGGLSELDGGATDSAAGLPAVDDLGIAAVGFTSGTSGRPRGVLHCQRSLLLAAEANLSDSKPSGPIGVVLSTMVLNIMVLGPLQGLLAGRTVVLAQRTDGDYLARWCAEHRIAEIGVPPTIVHDLLDRYDTSGDSGVIPERIETGGAACTSALQERFTAATGRRIIRCYGLTEAPGTVAMSDLRRPAVLDSSGIAMPHVAITIRGPGGEILPEGSDGEICISAAERGPLADQYIPMLGYLDEPVGTTVRDGVLHTGDLGRLDRDGRLYVTGRKSALIIRGGANISPSEIEEVLVSHPGVGDAAVFGVPDERLGEVVAAAVTVAGAGSAPSSTELKSYVEGRLARYKVPAHVIVLTAIPRNPTGKPDLTALLNALRAVQCSVV